MKKKLFFSLVLVSASYFGATNTHAFTVDFQNGLPGTYEAFEVSTPGQIFNSGFLGDDGENYYTKGGTALFGYTEGFSVSSIDVSPDDLYYFSEQNILRIQSVYNDGRPVKYENFSIQKDVGFQTLQINEYNLISIAFTSLSNTLAFDNIVGTSAKEVSVPEPASIALLGVGLVGLAASRSAKRH